MVGFVEITAATTITWGFPVTLNILNEVASETVIDLCCSCRMRVVFLQGAKDEIVERHPYRSSPVVIILPEELIAEWKRADTVVRPEMAWIWKNVENSRELLAITSHYVYKQWEESYVANVAWTARWVLRSIIVLPFNDLVVEQTILGVKEVFVELVN